jgi:chitodextrinase
MSLLDVPGVKAHELDAAVTAKIEDPASNARLALNAAFVPKWEATTAYLAGDKVLSPGGDVVSAKADFTSGASYSSANWDISTTYATPVQAAGLSAALSIVFGG